MYKVKMYHFYQSLHKDFHVHFWTSLKIVHVCVWVGVAGKKMSIRRHN